MKEFVQETGNNATIGHVSNLKKIADYGVMGTPSVVIDGTVKSGEKIPTKEETKNWLIK